ncbi:MarR family winged helix-turn-helix transcriptional regulator [Nocardioides donggukensis]|uniref:MarR family transcriptional regulator n=1 Tax=Nocardioides donggukensis TaxID=2774019 RepID=A0A927Q0G2_9ACTN|nr:MarR family transcriptional regulator [Nocardioides donggukensis]MBD8868892.1 MarR family transcriptional regulator [Nocardioides donggukensis]
MTEGLHLVVPEEVRWLDPEQQRAWRAFCVGTTLLFDRLDDELRAEVGIGMNEYEVLVRLSEAEDNRMRMSTLADAMCFSRSRITHTIARMQRDGLVERTAACDDGRGIIAQLTDRGMSTLVEAAPTHVSGVRAHIVDLAEAGDFAALGRVMDAVVDQLAAAHPEADLR